ncbi:ArnT family glycosyltransferase [Leptospira kanakyensis]|uniref:Phospholipid carrier-dependent glycosyltransferase n=1 Tax=Leptospira kanakyensis TaxID=2484968 RepID=A0A6N4Q739_9LEPT|nr:phospholipid carrier-dependent glycosyltransferase [Leptospira kanakyensis]MCW7467921.1 glycosyltransferase family 39 protein [Leptospira kanakyensis]MCW7482544.1 glycosyltransferase family 39 protein [Leptospira kanakyensis]TGK49431.1 phospholipid carrier-dependent glycosyltransferase [Leptospira kanakyensis]TGK60329.1 phospholipid carrier-dependent glycosyltransferase [Leptospira kanakyensis]TGK67728.1 phospholipid carrier-dependent glycosyltransferase [Leptospira kanakyensis]
MFFVILFIFSTIFAITLGVPDLPFPQGDEIMHIRSIRESLELGSYTLPVLSGLPNPYKPPLLFWLGMFFDRIFGVSYLAERLVSFFFGIGTLTLFYKLYLSISKSLKETKLATFTFAFSFLSLKFFGLLMMEGAMVFFTLLYIFLFYKSKNKKSLTYVIWGSFFVGFGYLLKGPILHIYIVLFLISYLYIKMIHVRNGKFQISFDPIWKEKNTLLSFGLSFLIPILWISYLYLFTDSGKELLRFFFITENMGKFYATNQSGLRIWGGWLLYTVPFTIPILHILWISLKKPSNQRNQFLVMTILVFLLFVTIFHLLPNRKDPYYVTPFISLLFLLPAMKKISWESLVLSRFNSFSIPIIYFLFVAIAVVLRLPVLFSISLFGIIVTLSVIFFFRNEKFKFYGIFIPQLLLVPITMVFLLRPMSDPDITKQNINADGKEVCVIAENPWTAMDVQNKLKTSKVSFALPLTYKETCPNAEILINYSESTSFPDHFEKKTSWYQWKQHLILDSYQIADALRKVDKRSFQSEVSVWSKGEKR